MIDEYITQLAENGLLGLLLVIALITIYFLYKENCKRDDKIESEKDKRITDFKETINNNGVFMKNVNNTLENLSDLIKGNKR